MAKDKSLKERISFWKGLYKKEVMLNDLLLKKVMELEEELYKIKWKK